MSGNSPDWIQKGQYFLLNGKKEVVEDYFFTSAPVHNSDYLHVVVNGVAHDFNTASMKPLDAKGYDIPDYIQPEQIVEFGDGRLDFVSNIWLQQSEHDEKGRVKVKLENYPFSLDLDQIKPVSDQQKPLAIKMIAARIEKATQLKRIAKMRKILNAGLKR